MQPGELLWTPVPERIRQANVTALADWLARERGRHFADYRALWRWSVEDLEGFWQALWDYFAIESSAPHTRVLERRAMPGAEWFPGARLNYAQHVLRGERAGGDVLLHLSETRPLTALGGETLGNQVRTLATELRALGDQPGDRVVAWMPNIPETMAAMLATTAVGAIWACCSPDFGERGTLDRFAQLEPKVLFSVDGYHYGGKAFDRRSQLRDIAASLSSLEHLIYLPQLNPEDTTPPLPSARHWRTLFERPAPAATDFEYAQVPFDHPLWTLFSSGTTGLPKPIVHGHGGILLENLKNATFHFDLHAGDRVFFYTTSGWMLWNFITSIPLTGALPVLYDGHPGYPTPDVLWKMADEAGVASFGASPAYVDQLKRSGIVPRERYRLEKLRTINLAGSPATPESMEWFYRNVKGDLWVANGSGGTDCCTGFVGGVPVLPVRAGEIQAPQLGVSAKAFNAHGESVVDEVGELVLTEPMPSMPLRFWNDPDNRRYLETYFQDFPGVWRHGDFFRIDPQGRSYVLGRSDATLNRYGIRIGTAEIYRTLTLLPEVQDALIVNLDLPEGGFFMPLFVKLAAGTELDAGLEAKIRDTLRREYTPRHVPDKIYQAPGIPYTLTGKKMEVPVRRILMGMPAEKAANRSGVADPSTLDYFITYAQRQQDYRL